MVRTRSKHSITPLVHGLVYMFSYASVNPLGPDMKMHIILTALYTFSIGTSKDNLSKYQDMFFVVTTLYSNRLII